MSYSGDAAEQVVKMSLDGIEVSARIAGAGAKQVAILLAAALKGQQRTKGKTRLSNMLRSGKELKVFAVRDGDLKRFCKEAKKYGVLYTVLKDRDATDGITDIMVRSEDASKVNRIFERFGLANVDMGSIEAEIERSRTGEAPEGEHTADDAAPATERGDGPGGVPPDPEREQSKADFITAIFDRADAAEREADAVVNPTEARTAESSPSEPILKPREDAARGATEPEPTRRSVRKELEEIKQEQKKKAESSVGRSTGAHNQEHKAPGNKKSKKKRRAKNGQLR